MSEKLENFRKEIIKINSQIFKLLKTRLQIAEKIGEIKKRENIPITDLKIEAEAINHTLKLAEEIGLDKMFSLKLLNMLIAEAIKVQEPAAKDRASFLYDIFEKAKGLELRGTEVIRLDVGEPDLISPIEIKDAVTNTLYKNNFVGYVSSKGSEELRTAIANDLSQTYGVDITAEQVLITPGGKFAIFSAILALISAGDRVVIPEPTWPVYGNCVRLANGRVDPVHTSFIDSWTIKMEAINERLSVNPKLFILCNPNNPTGKVFSKKFLRELAQSTERKEMYLLSDEVYSTYSIVPFESILQIMNSHYIYVNSFSKHYGMTGWRIGYAVSDAKTIAKMQSLLQISVTCVPDFIQCAALTALKMDQNTFNTFAENMKQRIDVACRVLDKLPLSYMRPDGGMYIYPKANIDDFHSAIFAKKLLDEQNVAIAPGEAFGDYPEHFRISLGTNIKAIVDGIERIGKVINNW